MDMNSTRPWTRSKPLFHGPSRSGDASKAVFLAPSGFRASWRTGPREGADIVSADGAPIGIVTSGGFGPSVNGPIAMGYVERAAAAVGTPLSLMVRGKPLSARIVALPFHPHAYYRA
jgi:glycine cleavage system aminomethyltransferase T